MHWPPSGVDRLGVGSWGYWWQAHLLDCSIDAWLRSPTPDRQRIIREVSRGIRLRNARWTNDYFDDMAWLGLALQRAAETADVEHPKALRLLIDQLHGAWTEQAGGGIWWRRIDRYPDDFKNVPANGPAAILLARSTRFGGPAADLDRAIRMADWIEARLIDPATGLAWDGLRVDLDADPASTPPGSDIRSVVKKIYTYCQGVFIGACVELALATEDEQWWERAVRTINAVATELADADGVLPGHGGGDGGLFGGILARYLALAAAALPVRYAEAADTASNLVLSSAASAWNNRAVADGGPLFGPSWTTPARVPGSESATARPGKERDLSVQLGAWMLLEAAAQIERQPPPS